jgi:hypothetical protein
MAEHDSYLKNAYTLGHRSGGYEMPTTPEDYVPFGPSANIQIHPKPMDPNRMRKDDAGPPRRAKSPDSESDDDL